MEKSLTLKYRPSTFEEVIGQGITSMILSRVIETGNFKQAYLFCGKSGCGKTTLARIFANAINKGRGLPIEIDGASNGGVDNVRAIVDSARQGSLTGGDYKIFIIDECHAISTAGWQAFLKSIEEPPAQTIYIFCTTEPNKVPATILNRVQRYNISPISSDDIAARLRFICEREGFTNYEETCDLISKSCNNGMRDAITLLEQCADYSTDLNIENAKYIIGAATPNTMFDLASSILGKKQDNIYKILAALDAQGVNLKYAVDQFLTFVIDLSKYCLFKNIKLTAIPEQLETRCQGFAKIPNAVEYANRMAEQLLELKSMLRYDTSYKSTIEAYLIKMSRGA